MDREESASESDESPPVELAPRGIGDGRRYGKSVMIERYIAIAMMPGSRRLTENILIYCGHDNKKWAPPAPRLDLD